MEKKVIPHSIAIEIARATSEGDQDVILQAYRQMSLSGSQIRRIRNLPMSAMNLPKPTSA